jgi:hypothetical protein
LGDPCGRQDVSLDFLEHIHGRGMSHWMRHGRVDC